MPRKFWIVLFPIQIKMKTQLYFVLFLILTIEEMPFFWKINNFNIVETIEENGILF